MRATSPPRSPTPELILDAAERIFAEFGYEGASMRRIAETARITQALLHYHYQTKERLYESVFERRSTAINTQRRVLLEPLLVEGRKATIEEILYTYYSPVMSNPSSGNAMFSQLVSSLTLSGDEQAKTLITKYYDPIAKEYITAFRRAEPHLSGGMAVWSYLLALGARTHLSPVSKRAERLSGGECNTGDLDHSIDVLVRFVAAGIRSLLDQTA